LEIVMKARQGRALGGLAILTLAGTFLGCQQRQEAKEKPDSVNKIIETKPAEKNQAVKLAVVKHAKLLEAIESARGKVLVIDFWGEF
jgi:hypothetical protein